MHACALVRMVLVLGLHVSTLHNVRSVTKVVAWPGVIGGHIAGSDRRASCQIWLTLLSKHSHNPHT